MSDGHERWGIDPRRGNTIICECGERFLGLLAWSDHTNMSAEQPRYDENLPLLSPRAISNARMEGLAIELPDERAHPTTWTKAEKHELDAIARLGHARLIVARVVESTVQPPESKQ